jgi:hypothetical protein
LNWAHELNLAVISFKSIYGVWPNIMQASSLTYRRIDLVANSISENIKGDGSDSMPVIPEGYVELSGFKTDSFFLEMCIDETLLDNHFHLVYDSDPDGEYEEVEDKVSFAS